MEYLLPRAVNDGPNGGSEKRIKHYSSGQRILLVGEGDFSFAVCLARAFGFTTKLVATSLDYPEELMVKYSNAMMNVNTLKRRGCTVIHGVDAYNMSWSQHPSLYHRLFDRIVFNFPHAGFTASESSQFQIERHKHLVEWFLRNARMMLAENGEVHITHKTGGPFKEWKIVDLAEEEGLVLIEEAGFSLGDYPGYQNKRGDGIRSDESFPVGLCSTYKFRKSPTLAFRTPTDPICGVVWALLVYCSMPPPINYLG